MHILDYIIFFLYLGGITLFGGSFFIKNRSSSSFTLGNSNIPRWVISMSIFATFVSSISFLALPGAAYKGNWNPFVFSISLPIASFFAVRFFVPMYRKMNSPSAYTFLERKYGPWAKNYASVCYILTQVMRVATILYLLALPINYIIHWNIPLIIGLTGLVVLVYSVMGGLQAVVWTDAIQGIILIAGALVSAVFIVVKMPEGAGQLVEIAASENKFSLGSLGGEITSSTFWVVLVYGIFINIQNFGIDQNYVQRYMASKTEKDAKRSALSGGLLYIPVSLLFVFIGTALYAYYQSGAAVLPDEFLDGAKSDFVFPYFIVNELPTGMSGLLIASILAAGMSTISTSFNSSATVFLTDFYKPYINKEATDKSQMKVLYTFSALICVMGIFIAIAMINVKSALDVWWKLASIFSGGMLGLFLLAAFSKKSTSLGAFIGMLLGVLVIFWISASSLLFGDDFPGANIHGNLSIVFGTTAIFLAGFIISWLGNKRKTKNI